MARTRLRCDWVVCVFGLLVANGLAQVSAQMDAAPPVVGDVIAARVLAEAQVRQMDVATSIQLAAAKSQFLDVELKQARAYWENRIDYVQGRQELSKTKLAEQQEDRKRRLMREWNLLRNHPEVTGENIRNGRALNFLLHRMDANLLGYGYALDNNQEAKAFLDQMRLTPVMVHGLNLRQSISVDGESVQFVEFPADGGEAIKIAYWPFLLRGSDFAAERREIEEANRATLATISTDQDSVDAATRLTEAFARLTDKFHQAYPLDELRQTDIKTVIHYSTAERFLRSKRWEVFRSPLVMTGDQSRLRFDPAADGDHLVALLTFMARNGLDFGKCSPGNEYIYEQVFHMMRDLLATDTVAKELEETSTGSDNLPKPNDR